MEDFSLLLARPGRVDEEDVERIRVVVGMLKSDIGDGHHNMFVELLCEASKSLSPLAIDIAMMLGRYAEALDCVYQSILKHGRRGLRTMEAIERYQEQFTASGGTHPLAQYATALEMSLARR